MNDLKSAVLLDGRLSASRARADPEVKQTLSAILRQTEVSLQGEHLYRVDFGPEVRPRLHLVSHDLVCGCRLGPDCPAVTAVKKYRNDGGMEARKPPAGYFPSVPKTCPICGARAQASSGLSSLPRGEGWTCSRGGASCYWTVQVNALRDRLAQKHKNPTPIRQSSYPFPPGYDPDRIDPPGPGG